MIKIEKNIIKIFINKVVKLYCKLLYKIEINGIENVPKEGALILCANHVSLLDAVIINCFTPRKTRYLAKEELKKFFFLIPIIKLYKIIMVKRDAKDLNAVKESLKSLKAKECLVIFPEGTRNGLEKNNGKMKNGATYFALKTGTPIVPIGIKGKMKLFSKIVVNYGKPIDYSEYSKQKITKEIEAKTTEELKNEIIKLTK